MRAVSRFRSYIHSHSHIINKAPPLKQWMTSVANNHHKITVPDLPESSKHVTIIHAWAVDEGEYVHVDQQLVTIDTAKAVVDLFAPVSGIVENLLPHKALITDGTVIATIDPVPKQPGIVYTGKITRKMKGEGPQI